jgi:hypothetical protein
MTLTSRTGTPPRPARACRRQAPAGRGGGAWTRTRTSRTCRSRPSGSRTSTRRPRRARRCNPLARPPAAVSTLRAVATAAGSRPPQPLLRGPERAALTVRGRARVGRARRRWSLGSDASSGWVPGQPASPAPPAPARGALTRSGAGSQVRTRLTFAMFLSFLFLIAAGQFYVMALIIAIKVRCVGSPRDRIRRTKARYWPGGSHRGAAAPGR